MNDAASWLLAHWDDILAAVGAVGVAGHSAVLALEGVIRALRKLALMTATKSDDEALQVAETWAHKLALALERLSGMLPRLTIGRKQ